MTRTGSHTTVPADFWLGRLHNARSFHAAARTLFELCEAGQNTNLIIAHL